MLDILAVTGPIYFIIALGYGTTRFGLFARADMRVFGKFVLNLCLPALLFNALAQRRIGDILNASYALAYLGGSLLMIAGGLWWARRVRAMPPTTAAITVMGISCSNSGFVGYPILLLTLAPVAGVALALNMLIENLVVIPLMLALAERGKGGGGEWYRVVGQSLARLASNPMIIGLMAGLVVSLMEWTLPAPVARTVNLFAVSSGALSLFVIGGTLVGLQLRGMVGKVRPIVFGKLILHPLAVGLAIFALEHLGLPPMETSLRRAAVVLAAMPMMGIYPILAQVYGEEETSAAALLAATVMSFFTLSSLLWMLQRAGG